MTPQKKLIHNHTTIFNSRARIYEWWTRPLDHLSDVGVVTFQNVNINSRIYHVADLCQHSLKRNIRCNISINSIIRSLILVVTAYYKCTLVYLLHNRAPRSDVARGLTGLAGITTGCSMSMEHLLQPGPTTQSEPWSSLRLCVAESLIKPLFCVHEDELLWASNELLGETGETHHVVRSHNELNVAKVANCRTALVAMRILSVRLSVCLAVSNACIVTKRKKHLSRFLYHTVHTKDHLA